MSRKTNGSITVFFSLISVLLLALLCTLMESVYVDTGRIYFEETVSLCSEGIFALYEKELWEDYGLLAFREEEQGKDTERELSLLLEKNFCREDMQEKENAHGKKGLSLRLLPLQIEDVTTEECIYLLDDKGKWYQKEVAGLMKYKEAQNLLSQLKDAIGSLSGVGVCMDVLQAETTAEESLSAIADDMRKIADIMQKLNTEPIKKMQALTKELKEMDWSQGIKKEQIKNIKKTFRDIQTSCREQAEYLQEAEEIFISMQGKLSDAKEAIIAFADALKSCKNLLTKEAYQEFQVKLDSLKNYTGMDSEKSMQSLLKKDRAVMEAIAEVPIETFDEMDGQVLWNALTKWDEQIQQYDVDTLAKMAALSEAEKDEKATNPLTALQDLLKNGVLELVTDTDTLSEKTLASEEEDSDNKTEDMGQFFATADELTFDADVLSVFADLNQMLTSLSDAGNRLINRVLLCKYGTSYFSYYGCQNGEEEQADKGRALLYEAEYQLAGKEGDKENLQSVVNRLAFIRTAMNYTYLKTDKEITTQVRTVAAGLAGVAGLEAFVSIIENALLLGLSYEEAIIDIAGLLDGRRVPFAKTKETFCMEFGQMAAFGKEMVQKKMKNFSARDEGIKEGFSYEDYLLILLLLTNKTRLIKRQCTLIQENMRIRYDKEYQLSNCLYAAYGTVQATLSPKFLRLHFLQKKGKHTGYTYETSWAYSY